MGGALKGGWCGGGEWVLDVVDGRALCGGSGGVGEALGLNCVVSTKVLGE